MTQSTEVKKSFNPLELRNWIYGWDMLVSYRYKFAERVNAQSGSLARLLDSTLAVLVAG
jgi:hypothetical protein